MILELNFTDRQIAKYQNLYAHESIDLTLAELFHQYVNEECLLPKADENAWGQFQQTRFIESIILGFPIFPISVVPFNGKLTIINGAQSVQAIVNFLDDRLKLWGLKQLSLLTGKTYSDLSIEHRIAFGAKTIQLVKFTSPGVFQ
jgi:hypothetical protein